MTIVLVIFGIAACEKYSDTLMFKWQSTPEQLAGNWVIARAIHDGRDVTNNYDRFLLSLGRAGEASLFAKFRPKRFKVEYNTIGKWFLMKQNKILLDFENNEADVVYHILKINAGEIWLKKDDEPIELHFVSE